MTDFTIPNSFIPGTKAKAQEVNENFIACKDAINSKANKNGNSSEVMNVATATENSHAVNKELFDEFSVELTQKALQNGSTFCAKSGNTNAQGDADLFTFSGNLLTPKIGDGTGDYPPCRIVNAHGLETILTNSNSVAATQTTYSQITPTMTSNTIPAGYTTSASSVFNATYYAYKAFDNSTSSLWASSTGAFPASLQVTLPSTKTAKYAKLTTASYAPSSFYLFGSNDGGTTKTAIYTGTTLTASASHIIKLTNETAYSTYGIVITSNANGTEAQMAELAFFEEDESGNVYFDETQNIYAKSDDTLYCAPGKIYKQKSRPSMSNNDIWLDTSQEALKAYKHENGEDVEFEDTPIGTLTMSAGAITSITTNPYNQNGYNVNAMSPNVSYAQSFGTNGYAKLPNGLIIQWGSAVAPANSYTALSFPIAFPTGLLLCFGGKTTSNGGSVDGNSAGAWGTSTTQFMIYSDDSAVAISWIALGY